MAALRPAALIVSVALFAALIGHVAIDVLGDYLLAHDTYDDIDHSSRGIVALVTFALGLFGAVFGGRALAREAHGSENAFCIALRSVLPRKPMLFLMGVSIGAAMILGLMEACDAWLAGNAVDDIGDLFGGSIAFGGSIVTAVSVLVGSVVLACLRRLAQSRLVAGVILAFLRRCPHLNASNRRDRAFEAVLVFHAEHLCGRIAGRAPPQRLALIR